MLKTLRRKQTEREWKGQYGQINFTISLFLLFVLPMLYLYCVDSYLLNLVLSSHSNCKIINNSIRWKVFFSFDTQSQYFLCISNQIRYLIENTSSIMFGFTCCSVNHFFLNILHSFMKIESFCFNKQLAIKISFINV